MNQKENGQKTNGKVTEDTQKLLKSLLAERDRAIKALFETLDQEEKLKAEFLAAPSKKVEAELKALAAFKDTTSRYIGELTIIIQTLVKDSSVTDK